jgi:transcriptional regulator with GAF, ATPase, and Fis domain
VRVREGGPTALLDAHTTIGRARGNRLVLDDPGVSATHCRLVREPGGVHIYDCDSTNGTYLNGVRIRAGQVACGASIRVGSTELIALAEASEDTACGIVGRSPALRQALQQVERVAHTTLPVLVLGESGTGKELVARAIHALSPRAGESFVAINCATIPRDMAESELFGHERGAFTGAVTARRGVFEEASGGSLFLDELGELPTGVQPKLLRTLETRTVRRVGGTGEHSVDVRVIAATNQAIHQDGFRPELYHRLARLVVELPPLRERPDDIPVLIEHFLCEFGRTHGLRTLDPGAICAAMDYPWPGNVRELRNAVERAMVMGGAVLSAEDLLSGTHPMGQATPASRVRPTPLGDLEREAIVRALAQTGGNQRAAARLLCIPRTTLGDRIRRYGLGTRGCRAGGVLP